MAPSDPMDAPFDPDQDQGLAPDWAVSLVLIAKELFPRQRFGRSAAAAWHLILDDVPPELAMKALRTLARSKVDGKPKEFISPQDVYTEVSRQRSLTIDQNGIAKAIPPTRNPDASAREQIAATRQRIAAIGNGFALPSPAALTGRPAPRAIGPSSEWDPEDGPIIRRRSGAVYDEIHAKAKKPQEEERPKPAPRGPDPELERATRSLGALAATEDGQKLLQTFMEQAAAQAPPDTPARDLTLRIAELAAEHERQDLPPGDYG